MIWGRAYFAVQAVAGAAWWIAVFLSPAIRDATLGSLNPALVALVDVPLFVGASALAAFGVRGAALAATVWTVLVTVALAGYATLTTEAGWGVVVMVAASGGSFVALSLVRFGRLPTEWIAAGRSPFAFRPANPHASRLRHMLATSVQIVVFWGVFLGIVPVTLAALEQRWGLTLTRPAGVDGGAGVVAGGILFVLASALGIWAAVAMSSLGGGTPLPSAMPNRLVIAGPYRFVRNPMAVAGIAQGVAVGLMLSSWLVVAYAIAGSVIWNHAVRPLEEEDLEARFGDDFRVYRAAVRCWAPLLRPVASVRPLASDDRGDPVARGAGRS